MGSREWSLEAAREIFPDVRERTAKAVERVERLMRDREAAAEGSPERARAEQAIRDAVGRWARAMEALGLQVKGPWLVDFDTGSGCYCWKWPETELAFFHSDDEGFAGRIRIQ